MPDPNSTMFPLGGCTPAIAKFCRMYSHRFWVCVQRSAKSPSEPPHDRHAAFVSEFGRQKTSSFFNIV